MRALLSRHFEGVEEEQFRADLAEKNWVLLLENDGGELEGFSTLLLYSAEIGGRLATVVYSGDTVVDPSAWGSSILAPAWIGSVLALHERYGQGPLYWLLLTSGFRTYRLLRVFWREYFPRFDRDTPPAVRELVARLARERFGERFDASRGVVRFARPQRLKGPLAEVPAARRNDPHVAFFLAANPGHREGDELACWAELALSNLTAAGRRMVRAGTTSGRLEVTGL